MNKILVVLILVLISCTLYRIQPLRFFQEPIEVPRVPKLLDVSKADAIEQLRQMTREYEETPDRQLRSVLRSAIEVRFRRFARYEQLPEDLQRFSSLNFSEVTQM